MTGIAVETDIQNKHHNITSCVAYTCSLIFRHSSKIKINPNPNINHAFKVRYIYAKR